MGDEGRGGACVPCTTEEQGNSLAQPSIFVSVLVVYSFAGECFRGEAEMHAPAPHGSRSGDDKTGEAPTLKPGGRSIGGEAMNLSLIHI